MAMTAKFPGAKFEGTVTGYRVSACLFPGEGFNGHFYVYVCVRADPRTSPGKVEFDSKSDPRGTLQISEGPGVQHTFENIDLVALDVVANHAMRMRVLEFRYDDTLSNASTFAPSLSNEWERKLERSRLGADFEFDLGGGKENLLGFASRQTPHGAAALRFASVASSRKNSWFDKLIDFKKKWESFTIPMGELNIEVSRDNVQRIYIDESCGDMLKIPLASLTSVLRTGAENGGELARFNFDAASSIDLIASQNNDKTSYNVAPDVVQTATFVFTHGRGSGLVIP